MSSGINYEVNSTWSLHATEPQQRHVISETNAVWSRDGVFSKHSELAPINNLRNKSHQDHLSVWPRDNLLHDTRLTNYFNSTWSYDISAASTPAAAVSGSPKLEDRDPRLSYAPNAVFPLRRTTIIDPNVIMVSSEARQPVLCLQNSVPLFRWHQRLHPQQLQSTGRSPFQQLTGQHYRPAPFTVGGARIIYSNR